MQVFRGIRRLPEAWRGAVAAIGNFDGVHRGHQAVVAAAAAMARDKGARLGLITFEPHPRDVIAGGAATARLTPLRGKLEALRALGVEQVMVIPFSAALMAMQATDFVDEALAGGFGLAGIVSGANFRFGHRRQGDCALLAERASRHRMANQMVEPVTIDGEICSSSRIRHALEAGDAETATRLLGRPHQLIGMVRAGHRRGRQLGFPTANTYPLPANSAMPATGIYTVSAQPVDEPGTAWLGAVASLGRNPTFDGSEVRLEVHVLDRTSLDLYGRRLRVAFHERLRGEERYDSIDALVAQIGKDCDQARRTHAALKAQASVGT